MLAYIVEDEESTNELECYTMKTCNFEVVSFFCGEEMKKSLHHTKPDIIILDVMLPDIDGISIISYIRKNTDTRDIPIILVSAKDEEIEKVKGLDAGADDYVTKPFGIMELMSRVKAVLRRYGKASAIQENMYKRKKDSLTAGDIVIDEETREVYYKNRCIALTYKEFELLKYLVLNKGIVLSRDKIMETVWGFDFQGESRTVDMHIKSIRQKLCLEKNVIKTIRNVGYKLM